jgi:uncharacterized membrane protein YdjX (TVP38/TMEM64 family)
MDWVEPVLRSLSAPGWWGAAIFIAAYVAFAVTLAPAFLLTVAAGAVFGLWKGTVLVYVGALLGASAVHALAAPLGRTRLMRWMDRRPQVAAVRTAVATDGLWIMFLLRLSPLVPFVFLNYALALSGVRYRDYAIASVGMLPAIVMYVYYGKVVGDVAKVASGVTPPRGPLYYTMLVGGLITTIVAAQLVARAAKRAVDANAPDETSRPAPAPAITAAESVAATEP